mmetsp:Transcript_101440/g.325973  ORF Transcript_101440/g.325973 Transcript_101440/m.325973 type:complete len:101 (-) Transcript_101440:46-348(-)
MTRNSACSSATTSRTSPKRSAFRRTKVSYGDGGSSLEMASARRDELRVIPGLEAGALIQSSLAVVECSTSSSEAMEEVRCHCEEDKVALLQEALRVSSVR